MVGGVLVAMSGCGQGARPAREARRDAGPAARTDAAVVAPVARAVAPAAGEGDVELPLAESPLAKAPEREVDDRRVVLERLEAQDVPAVGVLEPSVVRRHLLRERARIRGCYEQALRTDPARSGRVTVSFVIGADGRVTSATATGVEPRLDAGVAGVVRTLAVPKPDRRRGRSRSSCGRRG